MQLHFSHMVNKYYDENILASRKHGTPSQPCVSHICMSDMWCQSVRQAWDMCQVPRDMSHECPTLSHHISQCVGQSTHQINSQKLTKYQKRAQMCLVVSLNVSQCMIGVVLFSKCPKKLLMCIFHLCNFKKF
jgi:hypothetical protein